MTSTMTFHDYQLEINRLEAKSVRQFKAYENTIKLIDALKALQATGEKKEARAK